MQAFVNISTKDSELDIKYGMYNLREEREAARSSVRYILTDTNNIRESYIRLGFHLDEMERLKYYEDFGYLSMAEFCEANLGMDKSAVSRCINVFKTFASKNGPYNTGTLTMHIDDKWKDYSYSQLCEMLPLKDKQRAKVKPSMTVKEIRDLKNSITDISPGNVKAFVDYFREDVTPFTRENVIAEFVKCGKTYIGRSAADTTYSFMPSKVRVHYSEYYSFDKILDYYEKCGGSFEVATSQPEDITILYGSFKDDIFIADMLGRCKQFAKSTNMAVINPTISGKRLTFEDSAGNTYMIQYSVSKKKEG